MSTGDYISDADVSAAALSRAADVERLDLVRQVNQSKLTELRSQRANLEPLSVFFKRLELVINCLWPENTQYRVVFELEYEAEMSKILDQALAEVRTSRLAAAVTPPNGSGLIIPKG
jgi:hypothetical protein